MPATVQTPFDVLGVPETASRDAIRRAYRRLALRYHPDRNPDDPAAAEAFLEVQEAYRRLHPPDPDAGFDVERIAAEMQRAAAEAERRRARPAEAGRAWQQVHIALDRRASAHWAARLRSRRALAGVLAGVALAAALAVGLAPLVAAVGAATGLALGLPPGAALGLGLVLGAAVAVAVVRTVDLPPWAVETHWQGLRDLRWDVLLSWSEILAAEDAAEGLDLQLSEAAARRLAALVPASTFVGPGVYRLPTSAAARLGPVVRAQLRG